MASTSAAGNNEVDQLLKKAVFLLHSSHPDSATELRIMLDELIKQRGHPEKMLINTLSQKQLDLEKNFPGCASATTPAAQEQQQVGDEIINLTGSPAKTISDSPATIIDSDDGMGADLIMAGCEDDGNLKEFGDLNCFVCGEMMFTATNRLIECSKCSTLYHQECHKPAITDEEASEGQEHNWQCDTCLSKPSTSRATAAAAAVIVVPDEPIALLSKAKTSATSSRSSSTSNSSSPFIRQEQASSSAVAATTSSSSSKTHKSSRSHRERDRDRSASRSSKSGMSSSAAVITPAINIISAVEKGSSHSSRSKSSSHSSKTSSKSSSSHKESGSSSSKRRNK